MFVTVLAFDVVRWTYQDSNNCPMEQIRLHF
jgi:hypothetical protein